MSNSSALPALTPPRVWAPYAARVELETGGRREPLAKGAGGWWQADAPLAHGTDYAFHVDGAGPFPDPRSPWQPQGPHAPSRAVDFARFRWSDAAWQPPALGSGLIYELHVGTFTPAGTFDAAIERLDHLAALGVTHVELMPVADFPGRWGWGYDGVGLYAAHRAYGGPEGLQRLVDACHARGLAVLMDVVYNHLGPAGNYLPRFGPYFSDRYHTPWGLAVNLDGPDSDGVRRFFIDNALHWLRDYHCDGLRLDAVHAIFDQSAVHFLEQLAAEVRALGATLGRPLAVIAESDLNDPRLVRAPALGGYGLDAMWNDDFHHALHAALTGERTGYYVDFGPLEALGAVLSRGMALDGRYSQFRRRVHGRPATGIHGNQLIAFLQNHDQAGNRAQGERIGHLLSPGLLKVGAALLLTAPFVPLLFQGEEWGASTPFLYFTDHAEPELAEAVRSGRRREFAEFGWKSADVPDPQAESTYRRSQLDWREVSAPPHAELLAWHRALIALRRTLPDLANAPLTAETRWDEAARWFTVRRGGVCIASNLGRERRTVPLPGAAALLLGSAPGITLRPGAVELSGESVAVLAMSAGAA